MTDALRDLLAARTPRERALLAAVAAAVVVLAGGGAVGAVRADLARVEARVTDAERELARVRRLIAAGAAVAPADDASLLARLGAVARDAVPPERLAAMTPTTSPGEGGGLREERVVLRLAGASLDETVRLLHALAAARPPLPADRVALRKHADDPHRFDVEVEVHRLAASPAAS